MAANPAATKPTKPCGQIFDARQNVLCGSAEKKLPICVTICTQQKDCKGQQLLAGLVGFVKANGLAEKVDIDATFSSRPQVEGTIGVTIGDLVLDLSSF